MTLDQVATAQREGPDFFELLKVGLLKGSLGLYSEIRNSPNVTLAKQGGELYRLTGVGNLAKSVGRPITMSRAARR